MNIEKTIMAVLILVGLGTVVWSVSNVVSKRGSSGEITPERFAQAVSDEQPDICKTPPGYTDEDWREHMGHHPDRYAECLTGSEIPPLYNNISVEDLASVLDDERITLIDTHIPEQSHIPGTDAFIPYNEIAQRLAELPQDKNAPIVLYCRSGNMSEQASKTLASLGYTNVYNLVGGTNAWNAAGHSTESLPL